MCMQNKMGVYNVQKIIFLVASKTVSIKKSNKND